ncbi:MAG: 4-hydroxy-tetrahydrodipicolinate reductase [Deltaproteobacteria bacterium]|nr:4-hydroxy-tetrahydrodipicolinate reductase [Deltaproteobacteria bacterium]
MIGVCICGARGRMGRMLTELIIEADDLVLSSALEKSGHADLGLELGPDKVKLTDDAQAALRAAEVVLDFSLPQAVCQHLQLASSKKKPLITGTTGFSAEQIKQIEQAAKDIPIVLSANMSRGVFVLNRLAQQAARALVEYDAEIFEIHHKDKVDSPSGTAKQLSQAIEAARGGPGQEIYGRLGLRQTTEIGLCSARGGDVVGEHQVMFLGAGEQIILTHRASSRKHFCLGALAAVRFIGVTKPGRSAGLYSMADVFEEC